MNAPCLESWVDELVCQDGHHCRRDADWHRTHQCRDCEAIAIENPPLSATLPPG